MPGLKKHTEHINAIACNYFIQGFLAKAQAISTSIINKQSKIKYKPYRTKGRLPPSKFCLIIYGTKYLDTRALVS